MARVGIRHLQKNARALIARALAGETIELDQMIAEGRATGSSGDLLELKPLPAPTGRLLSEVLAEMRHEER